MSKLQKLRRSLWGQMSDVWAKNCSTPPSCSFSDPTQPLAARFLLLDTVLYCTVPWTLCLLFSGIYHVAKCPSLIFSQVACNGGRVLLQKPAKSYFLQRACQHSNLRMRKSFKGDGDIDYDEFLDFLKKGLAEADFKSIKHLSFPKAFEANHLV